MGWGRLDEFSAERKTRGQNLLQAAIPIVTLGCQRFGHNLAKSRIETLHVGGWPLALWSVIPRLLHIETHVAVAELNRRHPQRHSDHSYG